MPSRIYRVEDYPLAWFVVYSMARLGAAALTLSGNSAIAARSFYQKFNKSVHLCGRAVE